MKTIEELKDLQEQIDDEVYLRAKELGLSNDDLWPITDGVCNVEGYLKSNPKVMWVLKEPRYDEVVNGKPVGGGYSITKECFNNREDAGSQKSWQLIIYTMYGYLHGLEYDDMDYIRDNIDMVDVLKDIAYINVSKMPGAMQSDWNNINYCYSIWKPILDKQMEVYAPDVVVFGGTFSHFKNDLIGNNTQPIDSVEDAIDVYKNGKQILIDAYHPLQTRIGRGVYVNSIIRMMRKYCQ